MSTESKRKDQIHKDDKLPSTQSEFPEEVQENQFTLDSDMEIEGLVDSITSIEDRSKKEDPKKGAE